MPYPRRCPLCDAAYGQQAADDSRHATVRSEPGGTPSPWRPGLPGRLLVLACQDCRGEYGWDYFAGRPVLEAHDLEARQPLGPALTAKQPPHLRGSQPRRT